MTAIVAEEELAQNIVAFGIVRNSSGLALFIKAKEPARLNL